jgi:histidinol phosphatase-like PHP family hydrolase
MSRGYRSAPYPSAALLKELCACGGRILINSDSHSADTIGYGFKQAQELAVACGFKSVCARVADLGRYFLYKKDRKKNIQILNFNLKNAENKAEIFLFLVNRFQRTLL